MQRNDLGYAVKGRTYSSTDFLYYNKNNFKSNVNSNGNSNFNINIERIFDKDISKKN